MTETVTYCIRGCTTRDKHLTSCACTASCLEHDGHCTGCQPRRAFEGNLCRGCMQRVTKALAQVTSSWDAMMPTPKVGAGGGSALTLITREDDDEREDDVPRLDGVIDARDTILRTLRKVAQTVVKGRHLHLPPKHDDAADMVRFLTRHLDWIAAHDQVEDMYDAITGAARKVRAVAYPTRSEFVHLGDCPFVVDDKFCTGRVRSRVGDDLAATCSVCGQVGPVQWWEEVLGLTPSDTVVSSAEMALLLHERLHITIAERTVRRWAIDGRISTWVPFGPQPRKPRWRFEPRVVLEEVSRMDRECPTCGSAWSGVGEVCSRCYAAQQHTRPEHAARKAATPAPLSLTGWCRWPRNVVPDSHDTDRPERCHYSDLPLSTCACGNPLAQHNLPTRERTSA